MPRVQKPQWDDSEEQAGQKSWDEAKMDALERLLATPGMTHRKAAESLGWKNAKTIQRYVGELKKRGRYTKAMAPFSHARIDEVIEQTTDTYAVTRRAIERNERLQDAWEREVGWDKVEYDEKGRPKPCPTCGRYPLKDNDPFKWQAAFKGSDSINSLIQTQGKLLGQISESPAMLAAQNDEDFMIVISELGKVKGMIGAMSQDEQSKLGAMQVLDIIARNIFNKVIEVSDRRRRRLPEFLDVYKPEYKPTITLLPSGSEVEDYDIE